MDNMRSWRKRFGSGLAAGVASAGTMALTGAMDARKKPRSYLGFFASDGHGLRLG